MENGPWRRRADGLALAVRLTPKSSRDGIDGVRIDSAGNAHIAARVRAAPEKGAANTALVRLIADWMNVPVSAVTIVAGQSMRLKTVAVDGDPAELERHAVARLDGLLDAPARR